MVDIIRRGEPALMLAHWTGIYYNGQETGFKIFQEVVRRLHARFDHLHWMKLSEVARYWAARELTEIERMGHNLSFLAPFACGEFTVRIKAGKSGPWIHQAVFGEPVALSEVNAPLKLKPGTWCRDGDDTLACFALPKGISRLTVSA
jgi:hypothetical protein